MYSCKNVHNWKYWRWSNIDPKLVQRLVFTGFTISVVARTATRLSVVFQFRPRVLGFVPEQINNKLKMLGNVQKTIPYNILEVPNNTPCAFWYIQDGAQDGRRFHILSYIGFKSS